MTMTEGWITTRIGDVFSCTGGMTPSTSNRAFWDGDMPWISSKDVKTDVVAGGTEFVTRVALDETGLRICRPGAVLVVVRSGVLAHALPVALAGTRLVINQDLKALDSGDDVLNRWLSLSLRAATPEILANSRKDGTTVQSIRTQEILDRELLVPPYAEQKRIVDKVEGLVAQVQKARDRLERMQQLLDRFRQSSSWPPSRAS